MLEKTHWLGCMGSEELVDRDTEKGAEQSALNLVDLLGLEEGCELENEESWLYESPKKQASAERSNKSPIKWCRQVLDNPNPETEVACHTLIDILDQKTRWRSIFRSRFHRHPVAFPDTGYLCMGSPSTLYHRSTNRSQQTNKPNSSCRITMMLVYHPAWMRMSQVSQMTPSPWATGCRTSLTSRSWLACRRRV
ncbi:SLAIN motif-containing protein-like [Salmo salar]|uniref:SLAIN motif-containing protein-like n=1 Tax=Salmo salar TaxID=8030 RepID=A0ABM3CNU1_SALSA|nr:SLAIN motif-containing protein-like [Salmo salar]